MNLSNKLEKILMPIADKLSGNIYLKSISNGFMALLPVTMIGAIFALLANLAIPPYQAFIKTIHLKEIFNFFPSVTTNLLALYAVFLIAYSLSEKTKEKDHAIIVGITSLFVFLLMLPNGVIAKDGDISINVQNALDMKWLGAAGLFSAMIIGLLVPIIYNFIIRRNLFIKLPESVPPVVHKSFSGLIPGFIIAIIFGVIKYLFLTTSFGNFNQFIYSLLQEPLTGLGASPITFIILILLSSLFWFFGLHGGMLIIPFLQILYMSKTIENLDAFSKGAHMPNEIIMTNWFVYSALGGAGATLGLSVIMTFFSKSKQYKTLGKLSLPASICSINEPITFGFPIILNPTILVPFILSPIVCFLTSYGLIKFGIIPPLNGVQLPMGTPIFLSGWMTGGIKIAVVQLILVIIQMAIYFPFFKIIDNKAFQTEKEAEINNIEVEKI